jgi:hypothetical protein
MRYTEIFNSTDYLPHVGQARFHESDARFKLLIAGARFGKSLAGSKDVLSDLTSGDTTGWLVAPTYALALPEFRYLRDDMSRLRAGPLRHQGGERGAYSMVRAHWGSEVLGLSARLPHTLLGQEIDWLLLCEAAHLNHEVFLRYLRARLATRNGRLIIPTTPKGRNWVQDLYERGLGDDEEWQSFRYATWDNPWISEDEIKSARATLPESTFDEQYGGAFTAAEGRVYREFEPSVHVVQELQTPQGSIIYKGIDFGYTNPFCCLWATLDGDGRMLVLREYRMAQTPLDKHIVAIRAIDDEFREAGCLIGPAFADPSGAMERSMMMEQQVITRSARNDVRGGIELVRRRLLKRGDDTPGLLISAACGGLVSEFESYTWQESSRPGEKVPLKRDDHALDALRYLCSALDGAKVSSVSLRA